MKMDCPCNESQIMQLTHTGNTYELYLCNGCGDMWSM